MNFAFTEEQEELRSFIRSFLEEKSAEATVRELMDTEDGYDLLSGVKWLSNWDCKA